MREPLVYPVPTPVVATSIEERELLQTQRSFIAVKTFAEQAKATFVGIGQIAWNGPLHQDGFINDDEVTELIELGAVGEIAGWACPSSVNSLRLLGNLPIILEKNYQGRLYYYSSTSCCTAAEAARCTPTE